MNYTMQDYLQDLKISKYVFKKIFKTLVNDKEDLIQESLLALWKSKNKYDKSRGKYFQFAYKTSKNAMLGYIRNNKNDASILSIYNDVIDEIQIVDILASNDYEITQINENYLSLFKEILRIFKTDKSIKKRNQLFKKVLIRYYFYNIKQIDIAKELNITRERVSKIIKITNSILQKNIKL